MSTSRFAQTTEPLPRPPVQRSIQYENRILSEQVLVTGISGFIAKPLSLRMLRDGYRVKGTVRNLARGDEVIRALQPHDVDVSRLSFAEVDLEPDAGWEDAARGCDYVQHVASPFPMKQPSDRRALVPAARGGALRVLRAARLAGVKRIVLTSSMVAMMYRAGSTNAR